MKPTPYLKRCMKELDKDLRGLSKEEKVKALINYENGIKVALINAYPKEGFTFSGGSLVIHGKYDNLFEQGKYVGNQFGPLEMGIAKEFLEVVEKRKTKFSKPSFLGELYRMFGRENWMKLK